MTELPPLPNSVYALPANAQHLVKRIEVDRLLARDISKTNEVVITHYDANIYTYRNGELSKTMPKATGQQIMVSV